MKRTIPGRPALVAAAVVALALGGAALAVRAQNQDQKPGPTVRGELMKGKLEHANAILEGLTRADYPLIARHARALQALSLAADFDDAKRPMPPRYNILSLEFQDLAAELAEKAEAKNLDGATLAYTQLAARCVACHSSLNAAKK
jgi:cytochrome c556